MTVFIAWLVEFFYILALKISELLPPYGTVDCISTLMEGFIWWDIMAPLRCEATPFITLVHSTISIRKSPAPAGLFRQTEAQVAENDLSLLRRKTENIRCLYEYEVGEGEDNQCKA